MIALTLVIVILLPLPFVYPGELFLSMFAIWLLALIVLVAVFFVLVSKVIDNEVKQKKKTPGYIDIEEAVPGYKIKFTVVFVIAFVVLYISGRLFRYIWKVEGLLSSVIPLFLWVAIINVYILYAWYKWKRKMTQSRSD